MDPALLQNIYRCYREKRLADVVALLSDDFKFTAQLPDDVDGGRRSRSRAETAILVHKFMEEYDILAFDTGPIIVTDNLASAQAQVKFRHKRTGPAKSSKRAPFTTGALPTARLASSSSATTSTSSKPI